ncbi:MAG TPA: hypothetical protein DEH27_09970 [Deltaproteobacteria bacterium]|nr:hypothetical protein [Deltaproteobacteria bacterium]
MASPRYGSGGRASRRSPPPGPYAGPSPRCTPTRTGPPGSRWRTPSASPGTPEPPGRGMAPSCSPERGTCGRVAARPSASPSSVLPLGFHGMCESGPRTERGTLTRKR